MNECAFEFVKLNCENYLLKLGTKTISKFKEILNFISTIYGTKGFTNILLFIS